MLKYYFENQVKRGGKKKDTMEDEEAVASVPADIAANGQMKGIHGDGCQQV